MFTVLWTFGFILNGVPVIERAPDAAEPMELAECQAFIELRSARLPDWMRGRIGVTLDFPIGVRGDCVPVRKDA